MSNLAKHHQTFLLEWESDGVAAEFWLFRVTGWWIFKKREQLAWQVGLRDPKVEAIVNELRKALIAQNS